MGAAIESGLALLAARRRISRRESATTVPRVLLITDGAPTDNWGRAAELVRGGEQQKQFSFFAVGVADADMSKLEQICSPHRPPLKLKGLSFRELFSWLSSSLRGVSRSQMGETVMFPAPSGWASV